MAKAAIQAYLFLAVETEGKFGQPGRCNSRRVLSTAQASSPFSIMAANTCKAIDLTLRTASCSVAP